MRYDDAARIVLAIRRNALINRLPSSIDPLKLDRTMPSIDASEIVSVDAPFSEPGMYEVRTGRGASGELYQVKIRCPTFNAT